MYSGSSVLFPLEALWTALFAKSSEEEKVRSWR